MVELPELYMGIAIDYTRTVQCLYRVAGMTHDSHLTQNDNERRWELTLLAASRGWPNTV
jgi:hypothetical protein